jgi:hypothetical protein
VTLAGAAHVREGAGGTGLPVPCPTGGISMINMTYHHKRTVSRPVYAGLSVRK